MPRTCPPGVWCMTAGLAFTLLIIALSIFFLVYMAFKPSTPTIIMPTSPPPVMIQQGGDSRYDRAPQPLRDFQDIRLPINIPTQGLPDDFQSVGIVHVGEQILPLYGRRTLRGSDRWNYYTRTDTYNPVPLPVQFQKRNCMDDVGCQEILSGETVHVRALHKQGTAEIYHFGGPKYIPGLL